MMNNRCALYIPTPGMTSKMVESGYVDALKSLGWTVYVHDPKTKQCCRQFIETYGVRFIMTSSRYGVRQLSVKSINDNDVNVVVNIPPHEKTLLPEYVPEEEIAILQRINMCILHTCIEPSRWTEHLMAWLSSGIKLIHIPFAGNILKSLPPTYDKLTDVAMVANFGDDTETMTEILSPLFARLDATSRSYQVFGDSAWRNYGIANNGPILDGPQRVAHIYGTAGVCPNLHTTEQRKSLSYLNDRAFAIQLCGGLQVVDSELASEYFGSNVIVAKTPTRFINETLDAIDSEDRLGGMMGRVQNVASNHTYFHRLSNIFLELGMSVDRDKVIAVGKDLAIKHCSNIGNMLARQERTEVHV